MGLRSRNKGARSERALRDELLRQGWTDVRRVPLSGAVKTNVAYQDDVVGTAPNGKEYRFENKARATGFDSYYNLLHHTAQCAFTLPSGEGLSISLDPNLVIREVAYREITAEECPQLFKVVSSLAKKCRDWVGNAHILSLKQDRCPFIYVRFRK